MVSLENLEDLAELDLDSQLAIIVSNQAATVPFRQKMSLPSLFSSKIIPHTLFSYLCYLPCSWINYSGNCLLYVLLLLSH